MTTPDERGLPREHSTEVDAAFATALERLGYAAFRPGQREAVETLLRDGRLLYVAPTGGGKSLVYQLAACLLRGTSLVVSPLISLMIDQVRALDERGVRATFLASTLEAEEIRARMSSMARGDFDLVYVAPERLSFPGFRSLLAKLACPLVAVDEAHCISEWGHDFRPDYLQIGDLLRALPDARVLACTATATPVVRDEILERLRLDPSTPQLVHGFARPNLALRSKEVRNAKERQASVDAVLAETLGRPGAARGAAIVYAPTRKSSEAEARRQGKAGWNTAAYHAGLSSAERDSAHAAFSDGSLEVVVATNAFGMGIDRADVRAVIHLAPPGSIESYYQEVGRAGRDGVDAVGLLLVSPGDMPRRRALIESDGIDFAPGSETVKHKWGLFLELMRYAEGGSCRHDTILRYFGDEEETLAGCGKCDVCHSLAKGGDAEVDPAEVQLFVRKALSAVARIHGRFGLTAAAQLLHGTRDERLIHSGLDRTKTFGVLCDYPEEWLQRLLRRCITAGWVDFAGGDRPVAILSEEGREVMLGTRPARMLLPPQRSARAAHAGATPRSGAAPMAPGNEVLDETARAIFEGLRAHRLKLAQAEGVPPYVVASDRALRDIALRQPITREELIDAHGIGPAKVRKYGEGLVAVVAEVRAQRAAG